MGSREKRVYNLIPLVLIVKGRPEIQRNVQAHCDTLESTKNDSSSSVTLYQLTVTLANIKARPQTGGTQFRKSGGRRGGGGEEEGEVVHTHKTKRTQSHTRRT